MNELKIFENPKVGSVRTLEEDGKVLFCGSDVAKALGYAIPTKAVNTHCWLFWIPKTLCPDPDL